MEDALARALQTLPRAATARDGGAPLHPPVAKGRVVGRVAGILAHALHPAVVWAASMMAPHPVVVWAARMAAGDLGDRAG